MVRANNAFIDLGGNYCLYVVRRVRDHLQNGVKKHVTGRRQGAGGCDCIIIITSPRMLACLRVRTEFVTSWNLSSAF